MEAEVTEVEIDDSMAAMGKLWWVWLLAGIVWGLLSLAILRMNTASVTTWGVVIGILFILAGFQEIFVGAISSSWKWVWMLIGILFIFGGIIMIAYPNKTFVGFAEILGWIFLVFGVVWIIEAVQQKGYNDLWWILLIAGILMVVLAFWSSAQFLTTKAYTLLLFSGIWALLHGVTDIIKSFEIRKIKKMAA
jgi:uncharacterized membrane protein HdeD (DUF308 family)